MGREGGVNMNEVEVAGFEALAPVHEMSPFQKTIFGIKRYLSRGDAQKMLVIWAFWRVRIEGRHQRAVMTKRLNVTHVSLDGC